MSLQEYCTQKTLEYAGTFGQETASFHYPLGIGGTDDFLMKISELSGKPISASIENCLLYTSCRFHDQTLRTYARQIAKRSGGGHVAVVDGELVRNEQKFLDELGVSVIRQDLAAFTAALVAAL